MGFIHISPYASGKGAIEVPAKCLNTEYKNANISFHILHPPLTRTLSSAPLPIPGEFMADPIKAGNGPAKRLDKKILFAMVFHSCHKPESVIYSRLFLADF